MSVAFPIVKSALLELVCLAIQGTNLIQLRQNAMSSVSLTVMSAPILPLARLVHQGIFTIVASSSVCSTVLQLILIAFLAFLQLFAVLVVPAIVLV